MLATRPPDTSNQRPSSRLLAYHAAPPSAAKRDAADKHSTGDCPSYREEAAKDAWERTLALFRRVLV
ncbi:MAG: hypothetical protein IIB19_07815 [Chloroflexi bacterium]|nr:hypothetical protein [Chloroflexota bacterium]